MKKLSLLLLIISWLSFQRAFSQLYSNGLSKKGKLMSSYNLKIVETDSTTKIAKESVPFDRPFYIKVRRPPSSSPPVPPLTLNAAGTAAGLGAATGAAAGAAAAAVAPAAIAAQVTVASSAGAAAGATTGLAAALAAAAAAAPQVACTVVAINLKIDTGPNKAINPNLILEDGKASPTILIPIKHLRPSHHYTLTVTWNQAVGPPIIDVFTFSTNEESLAKRLSQQVIPQFGVLGGLFKQDDKLLIEPSVMVGVYYHLRPINPDIPMKNYRPLAFQRFSVQGGVTLTSMAVEHFRDDLFGTNNLMFGFGYQPHDALRLSYGWLLFKEINPNPALSAQRRILSTTYASITLDIKLKDIFGGLFTVLGFK